VQTREVPSIVDGVSPAPPTPLPAGLPLPPPQPRSPLGRLVVSVAVLAVGVLAMVDLAGAHVIGSAYLALPLAVIGAGLVVGAWYGRARALIVFGAVLTVLLAIAGTAERVNGANRNVTWRPTGIEQLDRSYTIGIGNAVLDLSGVSFVDRSVAVDVHVSVGNLTVIVPSTVDVTVDGKVNVGNARVFGEHWGGVDQPEHHVVDNGDDGPGGGDLVIRATVEVGDLEVRR
jgi:hypothetical protein